MTTVVTRDIAAMTAAVVASDTNALPAPLTDLVKLLNALFEPTISSSISSALFPARTISWTKVFVAALAPDMDWRHASEAFPVALNASAKSVTAWASIPFLTIVRTFGNADNLDEVLPRFVITVPRLMLVRRVGNGPNALMISPRASDIAVNASIASPSIPLSISS